jgi:DNA-binding response OmpR family regulator
MNLTENLVLVGKSIESTSLLQIYFSTQGYEVNIISWEQNLLNYIEQQKPALVILTMATLSDMRQGLEFFRNLRASTHTWHIPVVFVVDNKANDIERSYKITALELGADEYITIPFDIEELRLRIRNIFHQRTRPMIMQPNSNPEILIVEDDIDISNMMRIFFLEKGYKCRATSLGLEALDMCRESMPDIVLLDIMLPDTDGYFVCKKLRTDSNTTDIPIIFLTQKDERSDIIAGLELSADDYITKPFSIEELLAKVNSIVKRQRNPHITKSVLRMLHQIEDGHHSDRLDQKSLDLPIQETIRTPINTSSNLTSANSLVTTLPILFLAADPTDISRLRLGEELREIQEKLQLAKLRAQFQLHQRTSIRPADVSQALLDVQPYIVHFSGHGTFAGALCFENQSGESHPVSPDALAALFEQFLNQVHCVILNACYSEIQANAIAKHINYVVGMDQAVGDKAAIAFAIGFYQAVGAGRTIEDAYKLGCVQIMLHGIPDHLTPVLIKKSQNQ